MDKEKFFSILRYVLSALGAYLLGRNLFGQVVTPETWEIWMGGLMTLAALVGAFMSKEVTLESFQSSIRQIWTIIAGILIGAGKMTDATAQTVLGILGFLSTLVYSWLSQRKTMRLADPNDPLQVHHLNGADRKRDA